jgi:hypothetical protein
MEQDERLTVCVSGGQGAGADKSLRAEPTRSEKTAYKSRRLPAVRCTPCWAGLCLSAHYYGKYFTRRFHFLLGHNVYPLPRHVMIPALGVACNISTSSMLDT